MSDTSLFWLSFVDTQKSDPPDEQVSGGGGFLGVVIVQAVSSEDAVREAWRQGCNPGGQVQIFGPITVEMYDPKYWNRLLTADEAREL